MVNDPDFNVPAFLRPLRKMQRLKKMEKQQREREHHEQKAAHLRQQMQEAEQQGNPERAQKLLQQALRHELEVEQLTEDIRQLDAAHSLHGALFQQFSGPIRILIDNRFVFQPFWTALREHDSSERWQVAFAASKKRTLQAIAGGDTVAVLSVMFDRLYVLRNQLVHGGATWASRVNRAQVRDGAAILGVVVPQMLSIMLDHPEHDFGEVLVRLNFQVQHLHSSFLISPCRIPTII